MTDFEKQIIDIIKDRNGVRAAEIATILNCDRSKVYDALNGSLNEFCFQRNYKWYYGSVAKSDYKTNDKSVDKKLSSLCEYYLNCLSLEQDKGISTILKPDNKKYIEINTTDPTHFLNSDTIEFIKEASSDRYSNIYMGYPIKISECYSIKYNKKYKTIKPLFLFHIEYDVGKVSVNKYPIINAEIIKEYSNSDSNSFVYDLIALEDELGLNTSEIEYDIEDLVERIQSVRQWNWKERINPNYINNDKSLLSISECGIYNKAIIISSERSPFTIGLESELKALSDLSEDEYKETALHDWIYPGNSKNIKDDSASKEKVLLEVLPLNSEQEEAIQKSLSSKLTIVTGPPGTGKSQVVTDLLINAAWQGKTALFASKNNKAVDVVESRVNKLANNPILFRLGADSISQRFAEIAEGMIRTSSNQNDKEKYEKEKKKYLQIVEKYEKEKNYKQSFIELRNKLDSLEQKFCEIRETVIPIYDLINENDKQLLKDSFDEFKSSYLMAQKEEQSLIVRAFWKFISKKRYEILKEKEESLYTILSEYKSNSILDKLKSNNFSIDLIESDINDLIDIIDLTLEYKHLQTEFKKSIPLEKIDKLLIEYKHNISELSSNLWKDYLNVRNIKIDSELRERISRFAAAMRLFNDEDISDYPELQKEFKNLQKCLSNLLPCWAVTSLSVKGRVPFEAGKIDLLIIDEASQCDIASIIPLLYRAKSAVIIGDSKQLRHICSISRKQDVSLLSKYDVGFEWSYVANSIYDRAISVADHENIITLRDHHRSYDRIINFSNSEFYDGKLRVATNHSNLTVPSGLELGIKWCDVKGNTEKPLNGSAINKEEAEYLITLLESQIVDKEYSGSVGVVTPFRAQADYIRELIEKRSNLSEYLYKNNEFWVDTVHKFQGDEKDIIIFSPVISDGCSSSAISFLKNTGNLFNVAITRARALLIVTGNMEYCLNCGVSYLEHFVSYVNDMNINSQPIDNIIDNFDRQYPVSIDDSSVSEWEKLFYTALYDAGIKSFPQYPADKYKLDLAIFDSNRKLDIEIDGEHYHSDWNGELCYRDYLRNQRLFELGWDVRRFWVYQIRDDLAWCVNEIKKWIGNKS